MSFRNFVTGFLQFTLFVAGASMGRAAEPATDYPPEFFDKAAYIVIGKVTTVNETKPPTAELKSERTLYAQGGGGVASLQIQVPAPDAKPTVSCQVGDDGIWIVGQKRGDQVIFLPRSETDKLTTALAAWMDQKLTTLGAAIAQEAKVQSPFATPEAQQLLKDYVPLLQGERLLTRPMTFDQTAQRLTSLYLDLGIELGFPLNPKTEEEIAAATKIALAHPMFREHPPTPESPQYADLQKNLPMLACLMCEGSARITLTLSDAELKERQERMHATPESAKAKLDTRIEVLAEMIRLTRDGKLSRK